MFIKSMSGAFEGTERVVQPWDELYFVTEKGERFLFSVLSVEKPVAWTSQTLQSMVITHDTFGNLNATISSDCIGDKIYSE